MNSEPGIIFGVQTGRISSPEFQPFPKITRFYDQHVVVTEKIDGTNGLIYVSDDKTIVKAGSRNRWVSPGKETDNYGFARWVEENAEQLRWLGPGYHYGEWWGNGIGRGYNMDKKVFSLFNVGRFKDNLPPCCDLVPVLHSGELSGEIIEKFRTVTINSLAAEKYGKEFSNVEGFMFYFPKTKMYLKHPVNK